MAGGSEEHYFAEDMITQHRLSPRLSLKDDMGDKEVQHYRAALAQEEIDSGRQAKFIYFIDFKFYMNCNISKSFMVILNLETYCK